ncbi:MAG: hypothetical protein IJD92_00260 [Bacilli bacterium]|nr:hypothetical protein [Bacilli bacterium]
MWIEVVVILILILIALQANGSISLNKFIKDNNDYFKTLKEDDYEFLLRARYGDGIDSDLLFNGRLRDGWLTIVLFIFLFINSLDYTKVIISIIAGYFVFKMGYIKLKNYYKAHLHEIDSMLPYYLKSLEILIQHYTVPVAIGKSLSDAPKIFQEGLKELLRKINAGDSSITPYMDFAKDYPVRDSMRMMRLLYRLSLGSQERKQEQLLQFSRSISSLQLKARENRYKNRLEKMESKTMIMLVCTGVGVMILLVISIMNMF